MIKRRIRIDRQTGFVYLGRVKICRYDRGELEFYDKSREAKQEKRPTVRIPVKAFVMEVVDCTEDLDNNTG